jgi:hypothetical protein
VHVVVCGALQSSGVSDFFVELFHSSHDNAHLMAVALGRGFPSGEMMSILGDPKYAMNMVYLDGERTRNNYPELLLPAITCNP